jgi:hypothetical protein
MPPPPQKKNEGGDYLFFSEKNIKFPELPEMARTLIGKIRQKSAKKPNVTCPILFLHISTLLL